MKNIFRIILICISFLLLACRKDTPQPQPDPQPQSETRTLTFNLPSYTDADASQAFKSVWVPGDCIVVHGEYAKDQVKVTLEAGDISADGKSAVKKVEGLYPYTHKECSSVLYASYPPLLPTISTTASSTVSSRLPTKSLWPHTTMATYSISTTFAER